MLAALLCHIDASREQDRLHLRADHLAYIIEHRLRIFAGGPTLSPQGAPETMIIFVDVADLAEAEAFIRAEPYTRHGVFSRVDVRAWARVLPEMRPGALDDALMDERKRHLDERP
jgi:uncharacterized protein YciI